MATVRLFVGLDYHDTGVQECILDPDRRVLANTQCPTDAVALAALVRQQGDQMCAAFAACSGAGDLADKLVSRFSWSVDLAHPGLRLVDEAGPGKD